MSSRDAPSKTSRHTPGPWHFNDGLSEITDTDGQTLAFVSRWTAVYAAERAANAHLMAAAPTLLETLGDTRGGMLELVDLLTTEGWAETASAVVEQIRIIDAAIAKATGETA
jgi:hypothetical protein